VGETKVTDLNALYREHAADVRRFALYLSGDPTLADDVVSETFLRVWGARDRTELTSVKGYLFAIARNLFLKARSSGRRLQEIPEGLVDPAPTADQRVSAASELRVVLRALQELPEPDRAAVVMRAFDNLSYAEIAAALDLSEGAVKVKVHRARRRLARALTSED
jgi:RNA polymerase sigma-70 factor (ECF subfamily)